MIEEGDLNNSSYFAVILPLVSVAPECLDREYSDGVAPILLLLLTHYSLTSETLFAMRRAMSSAVTDRV